MHRGELVTVSEMAALHGVSRQTLILYDRNGLLKPQEVSDTGYRYYSMDQVPRLRMICLLKAMGVPLARVRELLEHCTVEDMHALLQERTARIDEEIAHLRRQREEVAQLDDIFTTAQAHEDAVGVPHVRRMEERRALFTPYPRQGMDPRWLHLALMDAWGRLLESGAVPSLGFGSLLDAHALAGDHPLTGAGSIIMVPPDHRVESTDVVTLPAGEYACMYKHSMPYDVGPARALLSWAAEQGLRAAGPVVDRCLLDTLFHTPARTADFCHLQVLLD